MRSITIASCFIGSAILVCLASTWQAENETEAAAYPAKRKVLRHVVLFKFKKSATKEQIQEVVTAFAALPKKIDTIIDFEMGTDVSIENKAKGFTHGFVVTFRNAQGRKIYLPHPAHKAFVKIVGPVLADVLVFDYYTTE
ncbi:MAG: Dabb family protein [Planctomycetaceae bacterium]